MHAESSELTSNCSCLTQFDDGYLTSKFCQWHLGLYNALPHILLSLTSVIILLQNWETQSIHGDFAGLRVVWSILFDKKVFPLSGDFGLLVEGMIKPSR